jgi:hypothetical protein
MIHLFFVGDGPRDEAAVPRLVERILNVPVRDEFSAWARLHRSGAGKGYGRKLRYATRQAKDRGADGLVATVDADKATKRTRLGELSDARDEDRASSPPFPTAIGEAVPHLEAWLLDDAEAVRHALQLAHDASIPTVRKTKDPKAKLDDLFALSYRKDEVLVLLTDIARELVPSRCRHASSTGFKGFADEVQSELGQLAANDAE